MDLVKEDFSNREKEIKKFLSLIYKIEDGRHFLYRVYNVRKKRKVSLDQDSVKIMKATFFLLLYNMVESVFRSCLSELYERIGSESRSMSEINYMYRKLWVRQRFGKLDATSANQQHYREVVHDMICQILDGYSYTPDPRSLPISGNLDARQIRSILQDHGVSHAVHYRASGGSNLVTIKNKRNALAHGDISFSECGREYTPDDLKVIMKESIVFLKSVVRNVERFIGKDGYAA